MRVTGTPVRVLRCPIEQRKDVLRQALDEMRCERIVYVDHLVGYGTPKGN